jgi:hypothetical protein
MKKWLILAAVVAMFAMMFPACGSDDGGGLSEAQDVKMTIVDTDLIVTWTGDAQGTRYDVVIAKAAGVGGGLFAPAGDATDYEYVQGQNVYLFSIKADGSLVVVGNTEPGNWSAKIDTTDLDIVDAGDEALVGVVALSPGGYSFGSRVVWGTTTDDPAEDTVTIPTP